MAALPDSQLCVDHHERSKYRVEFNFTLRRNYDGECTLTFHHKVQEFFLFLFAEQIHKIWQI